MFSWEDPFRLREQLSEDERLIGDTARGYADEKLAPRIIDAAREERFDRDIMREMGELGFFGITTPEKYGGSNAGHVAQGLLDYEVERIDSAYRSCLSVQSGLVIFPIQTFGSEEQREKFLPKLVSGEYIGAFGLTEPNAGSDPGSMETRASKAGGGYRLSGVKTWISNAPVADVSVEWAKSEAHEGDVRGFILTRHGGSCNTSDKKQTRTSGLADGTNCHGRCFRSRRESSARCHRHQGAAFLSDASALRTFLGCVGCRDVLLARRTQLCTRAQTVRTPPCANAIDTEKARRHAN